MLKIRPVLPAIAVLGLVPIAVPSNSFAADTPSVSLPADQLPVGPMPIGQYGSADPKFVAWPSDKDGGPQQLGDNRGDLTYRVYSQGFPSTAPHGDAAGDHWTIAVPFSASSNDPAKTKAELLAKVKAVNAVPEVAGQARLDPLIAPSAGWAGDVPANGQTVAEVIRVGRFDTKAEADTLLAKSGLHDSFKAEVVYDAQDGRPTSGPWVVRVVTVDPAKYKLQTTFGGTIGNPDSVRALVKASGAQVGINASEGVPVKYEPGVLEPSNQTDKYTGDVQGIQVRDDSIYSEANNGRSALVLNGKNPADPNGAIIPARIGEVSTTAKVTVTDPLTHRSVQHVINGINRPAGHTIGCGVAPADDDPYSTTWARAAHRYSDCPTQNDITVFRSEWGSHTAPTLPPLTTTPPVTPAFELLLDANWVVQGVHQAGGAIAPGQIVMQGIGTGADWLKTYAAVGTAFTPSADILDTPTGKSITNADLGVVAGGCGPALLKDGEISLNVKANGMVGDNDALMNWEVLRDPRTMVGITGDGKIQLVTVDGRDASTSIGMSFLETAQLMKWLGAKQALSLGCGGDTGLIMNGVLYNNPMDTWGTPDKNKPYERHLPNALVAIKK